ncbi:hypothetical protein GCM10025794_20720 [Massilia kyonggiensis]
MFLIEYKALLACDWQYLLQQTFVIRGVDESVEGIKASFIIVVRAVVINMIMH